MNNQQFIICYLLMITFQILHIFEEIYSEAYKIKLSLKKYLFFAAIIIAINFFTLVLFILNLKAGFILAGINAFTAVLNTVIHIIVQIKIKSLTNIKGSAVYSSIPLGVMGTVVLVQLSVFNNYK